MKHELKDYILSKVDPKEYYHSRFPTWRPATKANVKCVFHRGDRDPSLAINLRNGGAKCFATSCHASIGNIVHFESRANRISEERAALLLYDEFVRPIVQDETVSKYHLALDRDERARSAFIRATGITGNSIESFKIGFSQRAKRFTIPICDRFGNYINIRFYRLKSQRQASDVKIYSLVEGKNTEIERRYGGSELFPWINFNFYSPSKPLFIMASEKETILAIQLGLQAVCSTTGEGNFPSEVLDYFKEFDVAILFDPDKGGEVGAKRLYELLQICKSKTVLTLPFPPDYKGDTDFDDWINHKIGNVFALLSLLKSSRETTTSQPSSLENESRERSSKDELEAPPLVDQDVRSLAEIRSNVELLNKSVRTRGIIAAVSSRAYDIPWKFKVKTKTNDLIYATGVGRELVSFVGASDKTIGDFLSAQLGIKIKGWTPLAFTSVSEVEVVPLAEVLSDEEGRYTSQKCYLVGISVDSNTAYEFTTVPTTLTGTQEKVCIIYSAVSTSQVIDTWKFSAKETNQFKPFRCEGDNVYEKLESLATELAANHTKIYARNDWHIVCLLSWFCPIGWMFPGETSVQRGWLNSLAIGDTQTGKSQVVANLQRLLRLGDIVNAENCTYVGLVGGAIKTGSGQMMLRWGRLPLCDRKLVIIEELSGLSITEISNMSEVRSRGIARLDKGGLASQTPARTRLIALSNVRPMQKNLAQYLSGVKAIQELIGHPEDISRFDLIVTLIDSEVPSEIINNPQDETIEATFTPNQLQRLCQFAWSLKPTQVKFTDDAYISCLGWTEQLQRIYHPSVPLFKAASGRLLLARIGAAIATLQFNWDGESIIIEDRHIDAAVSLLRGLYDKPSFGYLEYSKQMQDRDTIKGEKELRNSIRSIIKVAMLKEVVESLLHAAKFTRDEVQATASIQPMAADDLIGAFLRSGVIRKGEQNTWEITPIGKIWLEKYIK